MLLVIDGFDHYHENYRNIYWPLTEAGGQTYVEAGGRHGSNRMRQYWGGNVSMECRTFSKTGDTVIVGIAMHYPGAGSLFGGTQPLISINNGTGAGNIQSCLAVDGNGKLFLYRGNLAALLATGAENGVILTDTWQFVELKVRLHDTEGTMEARVNGVSVLSVSGANTQGLGNANADRIRITSKALHSWYDDFYVCDGSGSYNNDFLGDIRVDAFFPTSDGSLNDFTPSTGTDRFALIDEVTFNDSDYVDGGTLGDQQSWGITGPTDGNQIFGIQVEHRVTNPDAGTRKVKNLVVQGATVDLGSEELSLSASYQHVYSIWERDPADSGAWSDARLASAEFGIEVTE